ncbi:hypothetical protein [Rhodopirellula europaea]|uniref:hypothetical protein n=1 Tax=Rhodopirellula europaea TaxID=1263866 RepID=UPI003D2E8E9D
MSDDGDTSEPKQTVSSNDPLPKAAVSSRSQSKRIQFGLLELLLLMTVVAVWLPVYLANREIPVLEAEIESMRFATTQLVVADDQQLNVRSLPSIWHSIDSWKYSAPAEADLELRLATESINPTTLPSNYRAAALPTGEHSIHLKTTNDSEGYHSIVFLDDEVILQHHHPKSWTDSSGSSSSSDASDQSSAYPLDQPLKLKLQRHSISHPLKQYNSLQIPEDYDSKGNCLWISPTSVVPDRAPVFHFPLNDNANEGIGHRQGIKVVVSNQTELRDVIGISPSFGATLGDNRFTHPYFPLGVSIRPILDEQPQPQALDKSEAAPFAVPQSLNDTLEPIRRDGVRFKNEQVTEASINDDDTRMRVFAHYQPCASGAKPIIEILFDASHPNRVGFLPHASPDSLPMKACQFVTRFDSQFLWREIEMVDNASPDGSNQPLRRPLASLYPKIDFAKPIAPTPDSVAPFPWRKIAKSRLPLATMHDSAAEMNRLTLTTDVPDATSLVYPWGLHRKWRYEGIPNLQTWWLPKTDPNSDQEISVEVRGGSFFPTTQHLVPGGPVVQNVRITVPMPATDPVWLEISAEPKLDDE